MERVLISGISGFTGAYVSAAFAEAGYEVFGVSSEPSTDQVHIVTCDLLDTKSLTAWVHQVQPDVVVHLAAIAFVADENVDLMYRTNIVGTRNLLHALATCAKHPRRVVLASSANVYGNATVEVIDESVPPAPVNDYAVSKLAMEQMASLWADKLPLMMVRPFNYTGRGQSSRFLVAKIVAHARERAPVIELGNLDIARDFSDVRDVANYYVALCSPTVKSDARVPVINFCSGLSHSLREVLQYAQNLSGHSMQILVNPKFVRENEIRTQNGSRTALESFIGSKAPRSLEDTIQWMLLS
jgi:GDP-6-deoxy-D-talose 4-dehydrogenase